MTKEIKLRVIVLLSIVFILFAFLGLHGTFSSGFHFVDDHEVIQMNKDLQDANGDVIHVIQSWLKSDLAGRFRPMYVINNVVTYTFFNGDFFKLYLFHALVTSLFVFFVFLTLRKVGFSIFESLFFVLITFVGDQMAIFWRLGPNESIGMWFLSLTLLTLVYSVKTNKWKFVFKILFCVFGILSMLSKESFLLLTPAIIITLIYLEKLNQKNKNWFLIIKMHLPEVLVLTSAMLICILYILLKVNTESLGYAGIKEVKLDAYFVTFNQLFSIGSMGIAAMIAFLISAVVTFLWSAHKSRRLQQHVIILVIALFIVLPQVWLYAKSGIFERYLLPGMLAWALILIFSLKNINEIINYKYNTTVQKIFFLVEIILMISLITPRLLHESKEANKFSADGKEVNTVLSLLSANIDSTSTVLFIANPVHDFERTYSIRKYLGGISGVKKMYTKPIIDTYVDAYGQTLVSQYNGIIGGEQMNFSNLADKTTVEAIAVFPLLVEKGDSIISSLGYSISDFTRCNVGSYMLYFKNYNNRSIFSSNFKSEEIIQRDTSYNELSFYPEIVIKEGDSIQISVRPAKEIKFPMKAFLILLDASHPETIVVHDEILGANEIKKFIKTKTGIVKPWLIYRNWGRTEAIPAADITFTIKRNSKIVVPCR